MTDDDLNSGEWQVFATLNPMNLRPSELSELLPVLAKVRGGRIFDVQSDGTLVYGRRTTPGTGGLPNE